MRGKQNKRKVAKLMLNFLHINFVTQYITLENFKFQQGDVQNMYNRSISFQVLF